MTASYSPVVSVIIPFLNGSDWLIEAVESVISQSFPHWEMILIDDGSKEEHSKIARDYYLRFFGKIIYTDHPGHINKGVTISRNLGISVSKGKYIAFLDSDDCWLPNKLENQLNLFELHPEAAMICEASRFWYSWKDTSAEDVIVRLGTVPDKLYESPELLYNLYPLGKGAPPCPTGIIIKREAFIRSGGFEEMFTGTYQLYEDQAFLCKIYLREKVYVSGSANNLYRKRDGSLTESGNDEKHYYLVRKFFLDWFENYLKQYGVNDSELLQLLHEAKTEIKNA
jgi:glycosyltransferase involved in cell wall biosynthesis